MEEKTNAPQPEKVSLVIPAAIIGAGILVAGAILWNGSRNAPTNEEKPVVKLTKGTIAEEVGLNKKAFQACLNSGEMKDAVEAQYQSGIKAGVQGTPRSIVIGKNGKMYIIDGAQPIENVKEIIAKALAGTEPSEQVEPVAPITGQDHIRGNIKAPVKIIEYSDTECPFCQRFHNTMLQITDEYVKNGQVAWIYRAFPLDELHSRARKEAEALECANKIGGVAKFWEYLDKIEEVSPLNNQLDPALL